MEPTWTSDCGTVKLWCGVIGCAPTPQGSTTGSGTAFPRSERREMADSISRLRSQRTRGWHLRRVTMGGRCESSAPGSQGGYRFCRRSCGGPIHQSGVCARYAAPSQRGAHVAPDRRHVPMTKGPRSPLHQSFCPSFDCGDPIHAPALVGSTRSFGRGVALRRGLLSRFRNRSDTSTSDACGPDGSSRSRQACRAVTQFGQSFDKFAREW